MYWIYLEWTIYFTPYLGCTLNISVVDFLSVDIWLFPQSFIASLLTVQSQYIQISQPNHEAKRVWIQTS